MFPARAGMNRARAPSTGSASSVPRASGDEPVTHMTAAAIYECSPRERG